VRHLTRLVTSLPAALVTLALALVVAGVFAWALYLVFWAAPAEGVASAEATTRTAEAFGAWKPWLDYGVPLLVLAFFGSLVVHPPAWVLRMVDAHHKLATGASAMPQLAEAVTDHVDTMPKREELQQIAIGLEAVRRETVATRGDVRELRAETDTRLSELHRFIGATIKGDGHGLRG
jgi:hypothetical protein